METQDKSMTIIAIVRLLAPLVATTAALIGIEVDADALAVGLFLVVALGAFIWAWWKNNNLTKAAQEAQIYLDVLKRDHAERIEEGDEPAKVEVTDAD